MINRKQLEKFFDLVFDFELDEEDEGDMRPSFVQEHKGEVIKMLCSLIVPKKSAVTELRNEIKRYNEILEDDVDIETIEFIDFLHLADKAMKEIGK